VYAAKGGAVEYLNTGETDQNKDDNYTGDVRGNYVLLGHDNELATRYLHLTTVLVTNDQQVVAGQVIGTVGSTGRSSGPHLHFDFGRGSINGQIVDRLNPLTELFPAGFLDYLRTIR